jgi:hypothetical protein
MPSTSKPPMDRRRDEVTKRMRATPPKPHEKAKAKERSRAQRVERARAGLASRSDLPEIDLIELVEQARLQR